MKEGGYAWHIREQLCSLLAKEAHCRSVTQTNSNPRKAIVRTSERIVSLLFQRLRDTENRYSESNRSKGQHRS